MSSPPASPPLGYGRFTGVALALTVFLCVALIGLSVFVKFELDQAETSLAASEATLSPDQEIFNKIRRDLGYGGFIGLAQNFAAAHDPALLPDMKAQIKQATDHLARVPEKSAAETRHDLQVILATFDAAMQKAEKSTTSLATDFTTADLAPLYAALPVLDARVANAVAADHLASQHQAQLWAMLLTLINWCSLIIASALAVSLYLVLRGRHSAPMRALAQSIKNMAKGDMRTPIWGMERQDAIGELARSVDMARFHFSQLPDMSLLSDQGPVRIRFEGNTRSLFEAMMRVISRDSEQVHGQANALTEAVQKQQEALALVIERVEAVLQNVESRAMSGDQQVRQALHNMVSSADSLKNAQEHAADQLNRIIPFLQERASGLAEITQITGKQVTQALQNLTQTERGLRSSAEQSEEAIRKFSSTADTLGERMFGAVNLLQASGKVLAETTEKTQGRLEEAIEKIGSVSMPTLNAPQAVAEDSGDTDRLAAIVAAMQGAQEKLEKLLAEQSEAAKAHVDMLAAQSGGLVTQAATTTQTLSVAADRLRDEQEKLGALLGKVGERLDGENSAAPALAEPVLADVRNGFAAITDHLNNLAAQIADIKAAPAPAPIPDSVINEQMRDHWYQMASQIEATRSNLATLIAAQTDKIEAQLASFAGQPASTTTAPDALRGAEAQMEMQTNILTELVATLSLLDAHMQELRSQVGQQRVG